MKKADRGLLAIVLYLLKNLTVPMIPHRRSACQGVESKVVGMMTPIPDSIIENNAISSGSVVFYMRLQRRGGHMHASIRAIAKDVNMKKDRVFRYLHELENAGLILLTSADDDNSFLTVTEVQIVREERGA